MLWYGPGGATLLFMVLFWATTHEQDKFWFIVKSNLEKKAKKNLCWYKSLFITTEGHEYLGGFIGSEKGRSDYVNCLIRRLCNQLEVLSDIARFKPQAAYTAFTSEFRHRFTYFIRTILDIQNEMHLIDDVIDTKLLPALLYGRSLSSDDRKLLSLPTRLGGLGIPIFSEICEI